MAGLWVRHESYTEEPMALWLPTQDLYEIKRLKASVMEGAGTPDALFLAEELMAVDGCRWRKAVFGRSLMLP